LICPGKAESVGGGRDVGVELRSMNQRKFQKKKKKNKQKEAQNEVVTFFQRGEGVQFQWAALQMMVERISMDEDVQLVEEMLFFVKWFSNLFVEETWTLTLISISISISILILILNDFSNNCGFDFESDLGFCFWIFFSFELDLDRVLGFDCGFDCGFYCVLYFDFCFGSFSFGIGDVLSLTNTKMVHFQQVFRVVFRQGTRIIWTSCMGSLRDEWVQVSERLD
jgi:hypothetical protein